jgi:muconate cycloisomerase
MSAIIGFHLYAADLPFRKPFKHAEAERASSDSIFVRVDTSAGYSGWGECLPRKYVTGERRDETFDALRDQVLPALIGRSFSSMDLLYDFLASCDGKTPGLIEGRRPQGATWCAVELALLDVFGREFDQVAMTKEQQTLPDGFRYSGVLSADKGWALYKSAFKQWLYGLRSVKLKVDSVEDYRAIRLLQRAFLGTLDVRVDANMAWTVDEAMDALPRMARFGVTSFEQPVDADDTDALAKLVAATGLGIMADESFDTRESLQHLIDQRACTAVNLRISKCGGLVASLARAREALGAGLAVQIGCQVGESSLLSAAQVILARCVHEVAYAEGCFGLHLLREDPVSPLIQFGFGGKPPTLPPKPGLGVAVDSAALESHCSRSVAVPG